MENKKNNKNIKINSIKGDVIISYVSLIVSVFITFFLTKYQIKYLGSEQFGVFNLVMSVIGYISILDLGIGQTVIRYVSMYRAKNDVDSIEKLYGDSFKNYIKISIIGLLIGLFIYLNINNIFPNLVEGELNIFKICFAIALINVVLQIPGAAFNAILSGYSQFKFLRIINLFKNLMRAVLIIFLLKLGFKIISVFVVDLILNQSLNILNFIYIKTSIGLKLNFSGIDKKFKKEITSYSFFVFLGIITDQIFWRTDNIILGVLSTTTIVSIYSISSQIINQYLNICATFSSVFLPSITKMLTEKNSEEKIIDFFIKASRYQFIIVIIISLNYIFLGKDFIILWIGKEYMDAYYIGLVIFISLTVPMFQTTGYQILYAMKKHKFRSIVYLFNAVFNVIMSIVLFKYFGMYGPAIATALAMFIGNTIVINLYYKKVLKLKIFKYFKQVCFKTTLACIIPIVIFYICNMFIEANKWVVFILKAGVSNLVLIVCIYAFSLDIEEKRNVIRKISKIIPR